MIKTSQSKAVEAYKIIEKLSRGNMPLPVAYKFFKMRKALAPHYDFQIEEENKLLKTYGAEPHDGMWRFSSEQQKREFVKHLENIGKMDVDIDVEQQIIPLDTNIEMSIEDMGALDGFVVFDN